MDTRKMRNYALPLLLIVGAFALMAGRASASELKIDLRTTLTGAAYNGQLPEGKAEYQVEGTTREFSVEVNDINLPDHTPVNVFVNGIKVGSISIVAHGGTLLLSTFAGQAVPNITIGSTVAVKYSGVTILHGKF